MFPYAVALFGWSVSLFISLGCFWIFELFEGKWVQTQFYKSPCLSVGTSVQKYNWKCKEAKVQGCNSARMQKFKDGKVQGCKKTSIAEVHQMRLLHLHSLHHWLMSLNDFSPSQMATLSHGNNAGPMDLRTYRPTDRRTYRWMDRRNLLQRCVRWEKKSKSARLQKCKDAKVQRCKRARMQMCKDCQIVLYSF